MSLSSILTTSQQIDRLRAKLHEDIEKTYPEGTLLQFTKYGKTHKGYVAHTCGSTVYICGAEGIFNTMCPTDDRHTILRGPEL